MEHEPLLSPAIETMKQPDFQVSASITGLQINRRQMLVTAGAFLTVLTTAGIAIRNKYLETRGVFSALNTFEEGDKIGDVPVHVRRVEVAGATHVLIALEMPPLVPRNRRQLPESPMDAHITPDIAAMILGLHEQFGTTTFAIDDRSHMEEEHQLQQIESNDENVKMEQKRQEAVKIDMRLALINPEDGEEELTNFQDKETSYVGYRTINVENARHLFAGNDVLLQKLIDKKIQIRAFESSYEHSRRRDIDSDPYTDPNHSLQKINTFLQTQANGRCNVVMLTGQPGRIEEAMHAFNAQNGPTFSAVFLTPIDSYKQDEPAELAQTFSQ